MDAERVFWLVMIAAGTVALARSYFAHREHRREMQAIEDKIEELRKGKARPLRPWSDETRKP